MRAVDVSDRWSARAALLEALRHQRSLEWTLRPGVRRALGRQLLDVADALDRHGAIPASDPLPGVDGVKDALTTLYRVTLSRTHEAALRGLGRKGVTQRDLMFTWFRDHAGQRIVGIDARTRELVRTALSEGVAQGVGPREVARFIRQTVARGGGALPAIARLDPRRRALFIARTEIHTAAQFALAQTVEGELTATERQERVKIWSAVLDARVRPAHAAAHQQTVPVDAKFRVGGEHLAFPGDPAGSGWNVINCRCQLLYARRDRVPTDVPVVDATPPTRSTTARPVDQMLREPPAPLPEVPDTDDLRALARYADEHLGVQLIHSTDAGEVRQRMIAFFIREHGASESAARRWVASRLADYPRIRDELVPTHARNILRDIRAVALRSPRFHDAIRGRVSIAADYDATGNVYGSAWRPELRYIHHAMGTSRGRTLLFLRAEWQYPPLIDAVDSTLRNMVTVGSALDDAWASGKPLTTWSVELGVLADMFRQGGLNSPHELRDLAGRLIQRSFIDWRDLHALSDRWRRFAHHMTVVHELGHVYDFNHGLAARLRSVVGRAYRAPTRAVVSEYGTTNPREMAAETVVAALSPHRVPSLPGSVLSEEIARLRRTEFAVEESVPESWGAEEPPYEIVADLVRRYRGR